MLTGEPLLCFHLILLPLPGEVLSAVKPTIFPNLLEPLNGYLELGKSLYLNPKEMATAFNFGPNITNNTSVEKLVIEILSHWPGIYEISNHHEKYHESNLLHLQIDKVYKYLKWSPKWEFELTVEKTIKWYTNSYLY